MTEVDLLSFLLSRSGGHDFKAAIEQHDVANHPEVMETWRNMACRHAFAGREQKALEIATVIDQIGQYYVDAGVSALSDWTFGNVYTIIGKSPQALDHYQKAENYFHQVGDKLNLARMQVGVVGVLNQIGRYENAWLLAENIWPILAQSPVSADVRRLAGLANNLGIAYEYLGRYEEALQLYEQKISLWEKWSDDARQPIEIARSRINLGVLKKRLNLLVEAQRELEAGHKILSSLTTDDNYRLDLVRAKTHLAHLSICQGAPPMVVNQAFERAIESALDLPDRLNLELALAEWQRHLLVKPLDYRAHLEELRKQCSQAGSSRNVVRIDLLLAGFAAEGGYLKEALSGYRQAYYQAESIGDWEIMLLAQHRLGKTYLQVGQSENARHAFEKAVHAVEKTRNQINCRDLRTTFLDDKLAVYRDLIALHLRQQDLPGIFHWIERGRARELVQILNGSTTMLNSGIFGSQLEKQLPSFNQNGQSNGHQNGNTYQRLPSYTPARVGQVASLDEVCATLPQDTLLLSYTVIGDELWVLPLAHARPMTPQMLGKPIDEQTARQGISWLTNLANYPPSLVKRHSDKLLAAALEPLAGWHERLISPLTNLLSEYTRLIIAPDGPLFHLPFQALYDTNNGRYLIETHKINYVSSATAWLLGRQPRESGRGRLAFSYGGEHLHHTHTEVEAISQVYPTLDVYTEQAATIGRMKDRTASEAELLHLATHAVFRGDNPLFSFIELADGRLEMSDILQLHLKARLVVLSACDTGRGLLRGGEYWGLSLAFLIAGAQSVIASQWPVDDASTAQFMSHLYQSLAKGMSSSSALREAQLAFITHETRSLRHPYYWAPFFLIGAGNAVGLDT